MTSNLLKEAAEAIYNSPHHGMPLSDCELVAQAALDAIQKHGWIRGSEVAEQVAEVARESGRLKSELGQMQKREAELVDALGKVTHIAGCYRGSMGGWKHPFQARAYEAAVDLLANHQKKGE